MAPRPSAFALTRKHVQFTPNFLNSPRWIQTSTHQRTVAPLATGAASLQSSSAKFPQRPALSILPLSNVIRTYLVTVMSSSPLLLSTCLTLLRKMLDSKSSVFDLDKNQALRRLFKKTLYAQFCGGENPQEVDKTLHQVKGLGYQGVILEYCLEVLERDVGDVGGNDLSTLREIEVWRKGMVQTIEMAHPRDFVALKWSGLGNYALKLLKSDQPPTPAMKQAIDEVCNFAYDKSVRLLPGAEWEQTNKGIDRWTLDLQSRFNRSPEKGAIMYNTYQAYLKSTPGKLADHLVTAARGGYSPGIKLVRGAYLASEPRNAIWDTKAETDGVYNSLMESLMRRRYGGILIPTRAGEKVMFPRIELVVATHNHDSVLKAQEIRRQQVQAGEPLVPLGFAQLQGMADHVSCELARDRKPLNVGQAIVLAERGEAFKSIAWGTVPECLHYLLRRATENMDAASRTADTRKAMGKELRRRFKRALGMT